MDLLKNRGLLIIILIMASVIVAEAGNKVPDWTRDVGAQTFPSEGISLLANDFGANPNGLILSTDAIQKAIDKCSEAGGGTVNFQPGSYLTGAIYLKDNVNLHIGEGVEIRGIIGLEDYPDIYTRVAGIMMDWPSAIINVLGKENVAITGKGSIHAQGRYHWERYWKLRMEYTPKGLRWASDYDCKRVRTILVSDSKNVTVKDITLKQAGFWTVHLLFSSNVTVDGITINNNIDGHGPSTDGIDIDSSSKILVENCTIDCNDDNVCLKAGRDADGLKVNIPTEYVVIRNCVSERGGGLVTVGSETSGFIRHVFIDKLEAHGTSCAIRMKSAHTRGGGLSDITVSNIEMKNVVVPVEITLNWNPSYSYASVDSEHDSIPVHWKTLLEEVEPEDGMPVFKDVKISNINATGAVTAMNISGNEDSYLENFVLEDIYISCEKAGKIRYTKNWKFKNVKIDSKNGQDLLCEENIDLVAKKSKF